MKLRLSQLRTKNKGQVFSGDFAASILVISVVLTIFLMTWNITVENTSDNTEDRLKEEAQRAIDLLIKTEGKPAGWSEEGSPQYIGFTNGEIYVLGSNKLEGFEQLTYEEQKQLLGAPNFNLTIRNQETGEYILQEGTTSSNPGNIVPINRNAVLEDNETEERRLVEVNYVIWY